MTVFRSFLFLLSSRVLSIIAVLISRVILARQFGPAMYGSFGNAVNLITVISRWGSLGIGPATQYAASRFKTLRREILFFTITISLLIGIIVQLIIFCFLDQIRLFQFANDSYGMMFFRNFLYFLPIVICSLTAPVFLLGQNLYKQYTTTQFIPIIVQTSTLCLLFFVTDKTMVILISQISYWSLGFMISFFYLKYNFRFRTFKSRRYRKLYLFFIFYSIKAWPQVILQFGISRFAVIAGGYYLSKESLGLFIVASNLSESFFLFNNSILPIVFNKVSGSANQVEFFKKSMRISNVTLILLCLFVVLLCKPIFLIIYGNDYSGSWKLMSLLVVSVIFHGSVKFYISFFAAKNKNLYTSYIQLIELFLLAMFSVIFCPLFQAEGLAYASIIASFVALLSSHFLFCLKFNTLRFSFYQLFLIKQEDILNLKRFLGGKRK